MGGLYATNAVYMCADQCVRFEHTRIRALKKIKNIICYLLIAWAVTGPFFGESWSLFDLFLRSNQDWFYLMFLQIGNDFIDIRPT